MVLLYDPSQQTLKTATSTNTFEWAYKSAYTSLDLEVLIFMLLFGKTTIKQCSRELFFFEFKCGLNLGVVLENTCKRHHLLLK